jgi:hypothetical protein
MFSTTSTSEPCPDVLEEVLQQTVLFYLINLRADPTLTNIPAVARLILPLIREEIEAAEKPLHLFELQRVAETVHATMGEFLLGEGFKLSFLKGTLYNDDNPFISYLLRREVALGHLPEPTIEACRARDKAPRQTPPRPLTAFMHFAAAERASIARAHPGWGIPEMGRELGRLWKNSSTKERQVYEAVAAEDKARYQRALAEVGRK